MFELAIHSKHQHLQAVLASRGVVLRQAGEEWTLVAPPSNGLDGPWMEIIPHETGVRIKTSKNLVLRLPERVSEKSVLSLPLRFSINQIEFEIVDAKVGNDFQTNLQSLEFGSSQDTRHGLSEATLARWLEALSTLNHWEIDSDEFLQTAIELIVDPLGFDAAYLLAYDESNADSRWNVIATHLPNPKLGIWIDTTPFDQLVSEPKVYFQPSLTDISDASQRSAVAFAPRLRKDGSVMGAIVGVRHRHSGNARNGIRPLEAKLLQLLSDSINQEQALCEQKEHNARRRKLLEQAFTPGLAKRIEQDPQVLEGCQREVTLLFADLRESSRLFEKETIASSESLLSPSQTYQVLSDVMDALTASVIDLEGLVIDYYGDGLAAMWNAPFYQPSHVADACQAAIQMQRELRRVSDRWRTLLGRPLTLGIGIHTGKAQVGNIGSKWKLKYGARGAAVNLASRLEQTTKKVETPIVVSGEVARRLSKNFQTNRLCRALVAGIEGGIDLYRLGADNENFDEKSYASVLALFESGHYEAALEKVLESPMESGPMVFMAEQIASAIESRPARRRRDARIEPRERVISFV